MRIDRLRLSNFKGFGQRELTFHPQFNLIVGANGSGKTSVLEALSIAVGSWFLGMRGYDSRHIRSGDVRLKSMETPEGIRWEAQYPTIVGASGVVADDTLTWSRTLASPRGRTSYVDARAVKTHAERAQAAVRSGELVTLPLLS